MKTDRLIKMANDISNFFNSENDKEIAAEGVKNHILRSWDPRMRKAIIEYCQQDGAALSELAKAAVVKLSCQ
jgi:formate dehydrogenase subunit delta